MNGVFLESLTWPEAEKVLHADRVAILPLGAQTKQHGPHLPLNTDWLTAKYVTEAIVQRCKVVALPAVAYGYYPAFTEYPGSVSLDETTFGNTIIEIIKSVNHFGTELFYIVNTGISTIPALRTARTELKSEGITMTFTDLSTILADIEEEIIDQPRGSHADEVETSMMLYMYPEKVNMSLATAELNPRRGPGGFSRDAKSDNGILSVSGSWGDPTRASRDKGRILVNTLIDRVIDQINKLQARS